MSLLALLDAVPCTDAGAWPRVDLVLRGAAAGQDPVRCLLSRSWWRVMGGRAAEPIQDYRALGRQQHLCRADSI